MHERTRAHAGEQSSGAPLLRRSPDADAHAHAQGGRALVLGRHQGEERRPPGNAGGFLVSRLRGAVSHEFRAYEFATRAIHAGQPNDEGTGAVTSPIYQTSTYGQEAPGVNKGYGYSRTGNPTRTALEANLAALEEAKYGLAFASGLAAINNVLSLLRAGDHVVACRDLYGGSYRLFTKLYPKFGVEFTFVDRAGSPSRRRRSPRDASSSGSRRPSQPAPPDRRPRAAAAIARRSGVLTVVDNTFATPYLQRPLALGADIVVHSTTKYLAGHTDVIGGALVTNDAVLTEELKFFQNAVGAVPGPQDCFLVLRGIKTLAIRMERHCANARASPRLAAHPKSRRVYFPGLPSAPGPRHREAADEGLRRHACPSSSRATSRRRSAFVPGCSSGRWPRAWAA